MTDKVFLKTLGQKIRAKGELDLHINQVVFSELTGISRMQLNRIEKGESAPSITLVRRIAQELNMSLEELVAL